MGEYIPVIGITFGSEPKETDTEYCNAVKEGGGKVKKLRPTDVTIPIDSLDGVVLSGGPDVHPCYYGEEIQYPSVHVSKERDEFELEVIRQALSRNLPVLGICRGIQILNVAGGGTLFQDILSDVKGEKLEDAHASYLNCDKDGEKRSLRHPVELAKLPSKLRNILGGADIETNSRHHQAIKEIAPEFEVTAYSADNIVEAMESKRYPWVVGIQWHPESKEVHHNFRSIFKAFVEAAIDFHRQCSNLCNER